ncbi:30S ribosomal protein S8 [Candidatus Kaiserbacteria bacterium RIFCSPLOWO2_01_FULL_52_12b]|uniref:Small ribosomal subunit protein uS8 n=1 Tax=Candidatus Kaiserbacteria bacterium RIFCSPLOWO2_01_FULL_52_12b TaxID=1798509 RepID=A0A1F6EX26_9BACT|nr:MAG: 30S ribosomal protein S8 [Candidatus Kaiserbacteria bacterium RIFCSPLOWO2_01_FULL_52_12b]
MVTDRVGDFIIRLQNAAKIGKRSVTVPHSLHLLAIAKKLKELGFLDRVEVQEKEDDSVKKKIHAILSYNEHGVPKLRGVNRISKPGRRLYVPYTAAHTVKGGTGALILSSPAGIISDKEARTARSGGEQLFEIW